MLRKQLDKGGVKQMWVAGDWWVGGGGGAAGISSIVRSRCLGGSPSSKPVVT